jgi:hypothetical protein
VIKLEGVVVVIVWYVDLQLPVQSVHILHLCMSCPIQTNSVRVIEQLNIRPHLSYKGNNNNPKK